MKKKFQGGFAVSLTVYRIQVPIPPPMDFVNAYLIAHDPVTLIDAGLIGHVAAQALEDGLKKCGFVTSDVRRIIFTHGHQDHYSLAPFLFKHHDCQVYIHSKDYPKIDGSYTEKFLDHIPQLSDFYRRTGIPGEIVKNMMTALENGLEGYRLSFEQDVRMVSDGDQLEFDGGVLQVIHCPGHSRGTVCFYAKPQGALFSGDHVLPRPIPNPVLDLTRDNFFNQMDGMKLIYQSLDKLSDLEITRVFPGHGPEFTQFNPVLDGYYKHKERFSRGILRHLEKGPASPFDIYSRIYKRLPGNLIYIGMSIVLGLLQILEEKGAIKSFSANEKLLYRLD